MALSLGTAAKGSEKDAKGRIYEEIEISTAKEKKVESSNKKYRTVN